MDIISYNIGATANERIEKFNADPDSNSGILTQPRVIEAGETVTIKSGRQAILADTVVDGELVIEDGADVFVPAGKSFSVIDERIDTLDSTTVKLTGDQTIDDVKTFTASPVVPTPTANTQAANKAYVDTQINGLGTAATRNVGTADGNVMEVGTGTRRIATGSSAIGIHYAKIGRVSTDTSIAFLLSGGGDYGSAQRQNIIITAGSRSGNISATHTELTSTNHDGKVNTYYVPLGSGKFDIWVSKAPYQRPISLHVLDSYGEIVNTPVWVDSLPTGAVLVTPHTYYHTGNLPTTATRWPTLAEVTGKPANYPTTWNSVAAKPAQATRWPTWEEVTSKPTRFTPTSLPLPSNNANNVLAPGFYHWGTTSTNTPTAFGSMVVTSWEGTGSQTSEQTVVKNGDMWLRGKANGNSSWTAWMRVYTSGNTTVDGNGFIKKASPILSLYTDKIEIHNESEFGATPTMQRISKGVYQVNNTLGLRLNDGWYIETPNDRNGNKYFNIEWTQNITPDSVDGVVDEYRDDIVVTIETFERVWNKDTGLFENGNPMDINDLQDRFVQLRFNEIKVEQEVNNG